MVTHARETYQPSTIMRKENGVCSVVRFISSVGVASIYMFISMNNASPDLVVNLVIVVEQIQFLLLIDAVYGPLPLIIVPVITYYNTIYEK
jgi:hypothetical protein